MKKFKRWAWWAMGVSVALGAALLYGREQATRAQRDRVLTKRRELFEAARVLDNRTADLVHAKDVLWEEADELEAARKEIREEEEYLKKKEVTLDERIDRLNVSPGDW